MIWSRMRVIGLSCRARRLGNTSNVVKVALNHLSNMVVDTKLIHLTDYDVQPCRNCDIEKCDGLIVGSPLYNGTIPALLASFLERNSYPYDEVLKDKVTAAIIVGSISETAAALSARISQQPCPTCNAWLVL